MTLHALWKGHTLLILIKLLSPFTINAWMWLETVNPQISLLHHLQQLTIEVWSVHLKDFLFLGLFLFLNYQKYQPHGSQCWLSWDKFSVDQLTDQYCHPKCYASSVAKKHLNFPSFHHTVIHLYFFHLSDRPPLVNIISSVKHWGNAPKF